MTEPENGRITLDSLNEEDIKRFDDLVNSQYKPDEPTSGEGGTQSPDSGDDGSVGEFSPWRERGGNYPYLVRGAHLRCRYGSHTRMLNLPRSHGYYMGDTPLMNAMDNVPGEGYGNIPPFGVCRSPNCPKGLGSVVLKAETVDPVTGRPYPGPLASTVEGPPCMPVIVGPWQNAHRPTLIGAASETLEEAITVGSFLVCKYSGLIEPYDSGQPALDAAARESANSGEDMLGENQACAYGNDPVNMATGNFIYSKEDIEVPGRFPLALKRFYNAMSADDGGGSAGGGALGKGWTHNYNITLREEGRSVYIAFDDGHAEEYYRQEDGSYKAPRDRQNVLVRRGDGSSSVDAGGVGSGDGAGEGFCLTLPTMEAWAFDARGRLVSMTDANGNATVLAYADEGLLTKVSNVCGSLTFSYDGKGRITQVLDHTGRTVTYTYDRGLLESATHPSGAIYRYEYDGDGKIRGVVNPLGITAIRNEYDHKGRTVKQSFPDGGFASTEYDEMSLSAITTEQNGNRVTYVRDGDFRTVKIRYEDSEESFDYNIQNKRTVYVDRNGNTRRFSYDRRGNLTKETDPLGGSTAMTYSEQNKPLKITTPNGGVSVFQYDPRGNLIKLTDPLRRETGFAHDDRGLVTGITLPDGSGHAVEYDGRGNITAIIDAGGGVTRYEYDSLNRVTKTVDAEGRATLFAYNAKGDISTVTNAAGDTRRYAYNLSGKVTGITDFDGGAVVYRYNDLGRVEEITDQAGGVTAFAYDLMWNITGVTDPNGNTVRYVYDQYQRVVQVIDEEGNTTGYEHDAKGNVTAVISPMGERTEIRYDALDRRVEIIEPDGAATKLAYDKGGNLTAVTDALGNTAKREYDLAGQLVRLTDELGHSTDVTYTPLGKPASITDATGESRLYGYSPGGRLQSVTLPGGESETYGHDQNGNVVSVTDALGNETRLVYDCLDRVTEIVNPLGHSKKFAYDAVSNIIKVTDEKGNATEYRYSPLGDIIEVIDALGYSTKYGYDKASRLTKMEQYRMLDDTLSGVKRREALVTAYERDRAGRVIAVRSPLGGEVKYGYDKAGNVVSKLDGDGLETLYEYDRVNKLKQVCYADGKTVEFGYNTLRQLVSMRDWLGTTKIEVDALGRARRVKDAEGSEVGYAWDALGRREKLVYPDGSEVKYEYNASGRLKKVLSDAGATGYAYDAMGRLARRVLPDGTTTQYETDALGRLAALTHSRDGDVLDSFRYGYDPVSNITRMEKRRVGVEADSGVFEYAYDALGRLIAAGKGDDARCYRYDELGNRVMSWLGRQGQEREMVSHSYNARNQLIRTTDDSGQTQYNYDGRGNLTAVSADGWLKAQYTYDATNMMTAAEVTGRGKAEYTYNGFRNRVRKLESLRGDGAANVGGVMPGRGAALPDPMREIRYTLDMTLPYDNLLATNERLNQKNFIWGNGLIASSGDGVPHNMKHQDVYYLQDHLGSPIRLLDADGAEAALAYDEFGVPLTLPGAGGQGLGGGQGFDIASSPVYAMSPAEGLRHGNPFGFTGYQSDAVTGLWYAQARYYHPATSRMLSEDIHWHTENMIYGDERILVNGYSLLPDMMAIKQKENLYSYTLNNPLIYVDHTGTFVATTIGALGGGLIGGISAAIQGKDVWTGVTSGFVSGAIVGGAADLIAFLGATGAAAIIGMAFAGGLGGAAGNFVDQVGNQWKWGQGIELTQAFWNVDGGKVWLSAAIGVATGFLIGSANETFRLAQETSKALFRSIVTPSTVTPSTFSIAMDMIIRSSWNYFHAENVAGIAFTALSQIVEGLFSSTQEPDVKSKGFKARKRCANDI